MLVSIAMTTYNGALYVKQQLRSLVSQTYKNIEIVIVDDCSTDSTIEII
ncbi:TPA: glycosyltransferase, partial [Escherichia coli]|nr:glycosyltransferase [Escherichia coli]